MKNSIIKTTKALFAPALFLLAFTSSTLITDQKTKPQTSPEKKDTATLEVCTGDIVDFKSIKNEQNQPIECEIFFIEKSTSATRKHYKMKIGHRLQEKIKEQDSCILISREGFNPLKINLTARKKNTQNLFLADM